jgi:hypothetical protein
MGVVGVSVFTIWREQSAGGLVLVAGDRPPTGGDACLKRIEAKTWAEALQSLHQFLDTQQSGVKS